PFAFASLGNSMTSRSEPGAPFAQAAMELSLEMFADAAGQTSAGSGLISVKAREAALAELRIGDSSTLLLHSRSPKSGICAQQLLVLFALDDFLPRHPGPRYAAGADYRAMLPRNSRPRLLGAARSGGRDHRQ